MLDYYDSYITPLTKEEICNELKNKIMIDNNLDKSYEKFVLQCSYDVYEREPPTTSYTGWYVNMRRIYIEKTQTEFEKRQEKKKKAKKKIRSIIRTCALLYMIYQDTIESYYTPDGNFVSKMSLKWNPLLGFA
jgi:hypothetical protein